VPNEKQRVIVKDLKKIAIDDSGWQTLYCDKQGQFWLSTFRYTEMVMRRNAGRGRVL
jgi:hypothetical protein